MTFQIRHDKKETENKTIRFPLILIQRIEDIIREEDISFSSFVIQACEYALNSISSSKHEEYSEEAKREDPLSHL